MTRYVETAKIDPILASFLEEARPFHRDKRAENVGRVAAMDAAVAIRKKLAALNLELRVEVANAG